MPSRTRSSPATSPAHRARAHGRARAIELEATATQTQGFHRFRFACDAYIEEILGGTLWSGIDGQDGLLEICDAINTAVLQLDEKVRFDQGLLQEADLRHWVKGQPIQNHIRISGCHSSGKTWLIGGGICNWFFDAWGPCIIETFAPSAEAVNDLLWKELRRARNRAELLPRPQEVPRLKAEDAWFARGRATSDAKGKGRERIQGQHAERMLFVYDEAEGIPDFVWAATETMKTGTFVLTISMANPRTKLSRFHKLRTEPDVRNFRLNGLYHPNVFFDRTIIPGGAISRDWVEGKIRRDCTVVARHDPDLNTFEKPWEPGVILQPNADFLYQVLAIAPSSGGGDVFVPSGRFEAAVERGKMVQAVGLEVIFPDLTANETRRATAGLDPARYGEDPATLYCCWSECLWREAAWDRSDSIAMVNAVRGLALRLADRGVRIFHLRVDAGGGWGSGVVDILRRHEEIIALFDEFEVLEVSNENTDDLSSEDEKSYKDVGAMLYATAGERLRRVAILAAPELLEEDLTERRWESSYARGRWVRKLQRKDKFRTDHGRSPNDGDAATLALAPIEVLQPKEIIAEPISF